MPTHHVLTPPQFAGYQDFPGFSEPPAAQDRLTVANLRCEYLRHPQGIDELKPRLSWNLSSTASGQNQTAYQIIVASSRQSLAKDEGELWDSGKVANDRSVNVPYDGQELTSRQVAFWKVRVWDKDGAVSEWSDSAEWSMGLLDEADWQADYISYRDDTPVFKDRDSLFLPAARQYRREFSADREVRRATIFATALGIYELHLNGHRVDDTRFAPGWCDYRQRAYYHTHDVTELVRLGSNALGAWVADGWYSGYLAFGLNEAMGTERVGRYTYGKTPCFKAQLEIEFSDGSREIVPTDRTWKVTGDGPIQEADLLMGEAYDARRELTGWTEPGYDDRDWQNAILASENGSTKAQFWEFKNPQDEGAEPQMVAEEIDLGFKAPGKLEAFPGNPVRPIRKIGPIGIHEPEDGVYIFNLGQNIAGVVRLRITGKAGQEITIRHGEMLNPDGSLMTANLRRARATDCYTCKGDPEGETYTPRFTYHGFQYVELTGLDHRPALEAVTGVVLMSEVKDTSEFECSAPVINRLYENTVWTQRANFLDIPTDCPQRDERVAWTGDAQVYARAATYNADVAAFYTKWLRELMESQRPSGTFPGYAPFPFQHLWDFGSAWSDAAIICPWTVWRAYDDTRVIEACWEPMTRFMDWRRRSMKDHLGVVHGNPWGDWLNQNEATPFDYIDTIYLAHTAQLMGEMAAAIGREKEAGEYTDLFAKVRSAFAEKYLQADDTLTVDTQTAYAMALFMDLIPEDRRAKVGDRLARKIRDNGVRMTTGFLGSRPLLPALSGVGHHDLAMELLQSHQFPSWGYEVMQGATTIWERWDGYTTEHGFDGESGDQNAEMNSFSHYSFGAVVEWMFYQLAGIDQANPGFKHIILQPGPATTGSNPDRKPIDWVKASYQSIYGKIVSEWRVSDGRLETRITIPPNTTATLKLPAKNPDCVEGIAGAVFQEMANNRAVIELQSGSYHFTTELPAD